MLLFSRVDAARRQATDDDILVLPPHVTGQISMTAEAKVRAEPFDAIALTALSAR